MRTVLAVPRGSPRTSPDSDGARPTRASFERYRLVKTPFKSSVVEMGTPSLIETARNW
jgi:hypothetical protein